MLRVNAVGMLFRVSGDLATITDGRSEVLEHGHCAVPVDAGVGDADAGFQGGRALGRNLLVTLVDVALDHDADDGRLARAQLVRYTGGYLGLVAVVLVGVALVMMG